MCDQVETSIMLAHRLVSKIRTLRVPRKPMNAGARPSSPGCSVGETSPRGYATCTWPWSCRTTLTGPPDPPLSPTPATHNPTTLLPSDTDVQTTHRLNLKPPTSPQIDAARVELRDDGCSDDECGTGRGACWMTTSKKPREGEAKD